MESLKKNQEFKKVYNHRRSMANRLLVLYIKKNDQGINRFGVSISRKVGKAVTRNRIKRLIKEQIRLQEKELSVGYDMVIVVRKVAAELPKEVAFNEIGLALFGLFAKQKIRGGQ